MAIWDGGALLAGALMASASIGLAPERCVAASLAASASLVIALAALVRAIRGERRGR